MDNPRAALSLWQGVVVVAMFAALGLFVVAWIYTPPSPYTPLGGDYVYPAKVQRGGEFIVGRSFHWAHDDSAFIERSMVGGDCDLAGDSRNCDIIALPSGYLTLKTRDWIDVRRTLAVPMRARPGHYALIYVLEWQDWFGRRLSARLPPLSLEVLP